MTTHNGKRITQRGGAGAGRGDNPNGLPPGQGAHASSLHASGTASMRVMTDEETPDEKAQRRMQEDQDYADAADRYYSAQYDF
jgi:hypothetical protein